MKLEKNAESSHTEVLHLRCVELENRKSFTIFISSSKNSNEDPKWKF